MIKPAFNLSSNVKIQEPALPVTSYFNTDSPLTAYNMKELLLNYYKRNALLSRPLVIVCIGSDRSTGDSLGPLIGYKLEKYQLSNVEIFGTLKNPVHAANLQDTICRINSEYDNPFIMAIDASLGTKEHVGYITVGNGPLRPGLGVNKELPSIGDMHITGIVNFSGTMETLLLQTTRLSMVMQLADVISKSVLYSIWEYFAS